MTATSWASAFQLLAGPKGAGKGTYLASLAARVSQTGRVVALARIRHHPETTAYYQRLLAAGKTTREARRCVKRALARHFYRRLREMPTILLTT